jgi:hypothetical protein
MKQTLKKSPAMYAIFALPNKKPCTATFIVPTSISLLLASCSRPSQRMLKALLQNLGLFVKPI